MNIQANAFAIFGRFMSILAVLVITIVICKFIKKLFTIQKTVGKQKDNEIVEKKLPSNHAPIIKKNELGLDDLKEHVATSIIDRHKTANDVIKTASDNIYEDKHKEIICNENESILNEMREELRKIKENN